MIINITLLLLGHTVECFEKLPAIGGVYVKSYQNTILTTSSLLTAWSHYSDGLEKAPKVSSSSLSSLLLSLSLSLSISLSSSISLSLVLVS